MGRLTTKKPNAAPSAPPTTAPQYGTAERLPDAIASRLRRVKAKVEAMKSAADAIFQHEMSEAAAEIGVNGIVIDIDAGMFARPNVNTPKEASK